MRDAKLEAMGLPPQPDDQHSQDRGQSATDEQVSALILTLLQSANAWQVMERFKKRMRK